MSQGTYTPIWTWNRMTRRSLRRSMGRNRESNTFCLCRCSTSCSCRYLGRRLVDSWCWRSTWCKRPARNEGQRSRLDIDTPYSWLPWFPRYSSKALTYSPECILVFRKRHDQFSLATSLPFWRSSIFTFDPLRHPRSDNPHFLYSGTFLST